MNLQNLAAIVVPLCTLAACGGAGQTAGPGVSPPASAPAAPTSASTESPRAADPPASTAASQAMADPPPFALDARTNPNLEVRIDAFSVPAASLLEFDAAIHENAPFLAKQPGFKGYTVFEKTSGPTTFNIVIIAAFENQEAMKNAEAKVRERYQAIGFNMQGAIARWGVTTSIGSYHAPPSRQ